MHVGIVSVVSGFVMDRKNETCLAIGKLVGESTCQGFSLVGRRLDRKSDNETLRNTPFSPLGRVFCDLGRMPVGGFHARS